VKKQIVAAFTFATLLSLPVALVACGLRKTDANAEGGVAVASASAVINDSASASAATSSDTPPSAVAVAPAANVPGVVTDPNARASNDSDDNAAKAEINKSNYKKEIDRLEKEDLNN
jgi:hypothetical protein